VVEDVKLEVPSKCIDFEVSCSGALLSCSACGAHGNFGSILRAW
jgi:hypothetical protein